MHTTLHKLLNSLEAADKRATPQRQAICQALVEHGGHPSAAEIFGLVREQFPMISQATVYNTLETLRELGLVLQLDVGSADHARYDLQTHPHLNIVCTRCGRITDMHTDTLDALLHQAERRSGYSFAQGKTLLYGLCLQCQTIDDRPQTADRRPQTADRRP